VVAPIGCHGHVGLGLVAGKFGHCRSFVGVVGMT
jgi:hypothetical protein